MSQGTHVETIGTTAKAANVATPKTLAWGDILTADDRRYDYVHVSEWGGRVRIRSLTAGEAEKFNKAIQGEYKDASNLYLAAMTMCDEAGQLVVPEDQIRSTFMLKGMKPINDIATSSMKLNGISSAAAARAAQQDAKNA